MRTKKKKLYNRVMDEKRITTDQTTIRINKYLSAAGVCSRREADQLTDAGRVTVAGKEIGTGEGFQQMPRFFWMADR